MTNKIDNDKYYTPKILSKWCIDKTYEIIGEKNISNIIEPSAGDGSFSHQIKRACTAYDIDPEGDNIIKQDFLELDIKYSKGTLIIGNPPFGSRMNTARSFYKKSIMIADYIAFILPIGQLNNSNALYDFDLIYSKDLGIVNYSDRKLNCCFNIYKRPKDGLNKRNKNKLKDIEIIRYDSKRYDGINNHDIIMCYWGNGSAGKLVNIAHTYSAEYKIVIKNDELKQEILDVFHNTDWKDVVKDTSMRCIKQWQIMKVLKDNVDGIK